MIMMFANILMYNPCDLGATLQQQWVSISLIIILAGMALAAFVYAAGSIFPAIFKERFRGLARFEMVQAFISLVIIMAIILFSQFTCSISASMGSSLLGQSVNPFTFARYYVSNLLFSNGFGIMAGLYSIGIKYITVAAIVDHVVEAITGSVNTIPFISRSLFDIRIYLGSSVLTLFIGPTQAISNLFASFSNLYTGIFAVMVIISFAVLLIVFVMLSLLQDFVLVMIVPLTIVMRSLSFLGPRLRESANTILAIFLSFYFIFPMMVIFNSYMMGWMYCQHVSPCNPYAKYIAPQATNLLPINTFFTASVLSPTTFGGLLKAPTGFDSAVTNIFGGFSFLTSNLGWGDILSLLDAPKYADAVSGQISEYLFEAIILTSLDFAVTIAFALSLVKSLNAVTDFMGQGQFWGGV